MGQVVGQCTNHRMQNLHNFVCTKPKQLRDYRKGIYSTNIIIQPVTAHADFKGCFMSLKY